MDTTVLAMLLTKLPLRRVYAQKHPVPLRYPCFVLFVWIPNESRADRLLLNTSFPDRVIHLLTLGVRTRSNAHRHAEIAWADDNATESGHRENVHDVARTLRALNYDENEKIANRIERPQVRVLH